MRVYLVRCIIDQTRFDGFQIYDFNSNGGIEGDMKIRGSVPGGFGSRSDRARGIEAQFDSISPAGAVVVILEGER